MRLKLAWQTRLRDRFYDLYVHEPMQKVIGDRLRPAASKDDAGGFKDPVKSVQWIDAVLRDRDAVKNFSQRVEKERPPMELRYMRDVADDEQRIGAMVVTPSCEDA
jgi:hypothetical protein